MGRRRDAAARWEVDHPFIIARTSGGANRRRCSPRPPPVCIPLVGAPTATTATVCSRSWRVGAEFPSEPRLHLAVNGRGVVCRSRGRPHQNQNAGGDGRPGQRPLLAARAAGTARAEPTTSGGVCRLANRHELAAPAAGLLGRLAPRLLAFEKPLGRLGGPSSGSARLRAPCSCAGTRAARAAS